MLVLCFILTVLEITACVPIRDPYLQDLCDTASQPCISEGSVGYDASPAMINVVANLSDSIENHLMVKLLVEIEETKENTRNIYNNIQGWASYLNGEDKAALENLLTSIFLISLTNHSGLSEQENSRLQALLQYTNYVVFLKKLDNDSAFRNSTATALRELRFKIQQVTCTLRKLLPNVSAANLAIYAEQDLQEHYFSIADEKPGMKRALCCLVVNMIQNTFNHTKVNINTRSIVISEDV